MPAAKDFDGETVYFQGKSSKIGLKPNTPYKVNVVGSDVLLSNGPTLFGTRVVIFAKTFEKMLQKDELVLDVQHELGKPESVQYVSKTRQLLEAGKSLKYTGDDPYFLIGTRADKTLVAEDQDGLHFITKTFWVIEFTDRSIKAEDYAPIIDGLMKKNRMEYDDECYFSDGWTHGHITDDDYHSSGELNTEGDDFMMYARFDGDEEKWLKQNVNPKIVAALEKLGFEFDPR